MLFILINMLSYGSIAANSNYEDCGTRYALNRFEAAISFGGKTLRSEFPWHVAIYLQYNTEGSAEYICGGSILHPKVILTAAHCVYNETYSGIDHANFTVITGKYHVSWDHKDPGEQRFKVVKIEIPPKYVGFKNRYAEDIALLELNATINFTSAIKPVCIDWNSEYMVEQLPTFGTVVGWGLTEKNVISDELLMANLQYINFTKCRDKISSEFSFFVTSDKFCAGLDNGTAVQRGDSGGGITFPRNTNDNKVQYYLYGIVSLKDSSRNNIAAFTDVRKHLHWLNITLISIINPALFDPSCPLLPSNSVTLAHCSLNGTSIDCNTGARPGTKAKLLCKSSYHDGSPFKLYTETECSAELKWLPLPESCIDCGKRHQFNQIRPLVKFKPRTVSEYPWHVGIYRKRNLEMRMLCGGTIIHPKAVITVAHCVTNQHVLKNLDVTKLFVAAGKFKSSWNEPEPAVQKFQVKKIYIKDSYEGLDLFYRDDIAILELNGTINLSDYIMPVCIDWSEKLDLFRNPLISGTTSGWGYTEHQEISSELRSSKLHYSDRLPCMKLVSNTISYVTPDKFCGISLEGSIPSAGDSGGALTFPHYNAEIGEELNYLYGLVSTDGSDDVIILTNVTYHLDWIKTILLSIINNSDGSIAANSNYEDCGTRYALNRFEAAISFGGKTLRSEFPWHVAIYLQYNTEGSAEYICGGSILHPKVILTAAHCVYNETYSGIDHANFTVITGKYHVSWDHKDPGEQRFKVVKIEIPPKYVGFKNRYAEDIALLELNATINFTSAIKPVCIDWNSEYMVEQLPTFGTVVGWGLTEKNVISDELLMANLKYINFTNCRDKISSDFSFFVTSDKFCAGLDNGTAVQRGDSGGGITFPRNTNDNKVQYYLYGIVSLKDSSRNNIAAFTDVRKHLHWLNITLISIINPALFDPGCPLLPSNSVTLAHCSLNGTSIDCNTGARPGTKAKLLCKSSYHDGSPFKLYTETECSAELKWLPLPESCIDCGKRHQFNQIRPLVKFKPRTVSEYPWHVGIYRKRNLEMRMLCGGTIIHPKAVITVAHCVTDQHVLNNLDVTKLFVAAGKFKSGWNEPEPAVQKFQVKKIYIKDSYKGLDLFFRDDIAILELNGTINLSDYIMPVCIDWSEKLDLFRNPLISGTTSGWGYTEDEEISSELRSSKLHYSDRLPCMKLVSNTRLITPDKFCGISLEGSIPSSGDSGGALTFPHYNAEIGEELNYLYGLVSTAGSDDVVTLTNVTYHLDWIKTILLSIINNSGT